MIAKNTLQLAFATKLVPHELEKVFKQIEKFQEDLPAGVPMLSFDEVELDLSSVEWAELSAVAQIVLILQNYGRSVTSINVKMPSGKPLATDQAQRNLEDRHRACRFLGYLRFAECVEAIGPMVGCEVSIFRDGLAWDFASNDSTRESYLRVAPLRWVSLDDRTARDAIVTHLVDATHDSGQGLEEIDSRALSNVLLHELLENVNDHAKTDSLALICGFVHKPGAVSHVDDYLPEERPFLKLTNQAEQHLVEVLIGDAGPGIVATLNESYMRGPGKLSHGQTKKGKAVPSSVVRWAFDRWSSAKVDDPLRRGVRGLYRVDRIAAKYQGQVTVRTGRVVLVRDHSQYSNPVESWNPAPKSNSLFQGTLVRARLVPRAAAKLRLPSREQGPPASKNKKTLLTLGGIKVVHAGSLVPTGFTPQAELEIVRALAAAPVRPSSLYVMFDSAEECAKSSIEGALLFLVRHGSPVPIFALNVPGSDDEVATFVDSVNSQISASAQNAARSASLVESSDTVCVVSQSGHVAWAGIPNELHEYLSKTGAAPHSALGNEKLSRALMASSQMLSRFFDLTAGANGELTLEGISRAFSLQDLVQQFGSELAGGVGNDPPLSGVDKSGPFLTPSLRIVHTWFDVSRLLAAQNTALNDRITFALCAKTRSILGKIDGALLLSPPGTSAMRARLGHVFNLRLSTEESSAAQSGNVSFREHHTQHAVVYVDLLSSMESARRLVQLAVKADIFVIGIVSLLDMRAGVTNALTIMGRNIPLVALAHYPTEMPSGPYAVALSPSLRWTERLDEFDQIGNRRDPLLDDASALRLGHFKRKNGRHLILSLDSNTLLNDPRLHQRLAAQLAESFPIEPGGESNQICVLVPSDFPVAPEWEQQVKALFAKTSDAMEISVRFVPRVVVGGLSLLNCGGVKSDDFEHFNGVAVFDWGAVTGSTLRQLAMFAGINGARNLLIFVANDQMTSDDSKFLESTARICVPRKIIGLDLFEEPKVVTTEIRLHYGRFSRLKLGQFTAVDCPVCAQIRVLQNLPRSETFLDDYVRQQIDNLENYRPIQLHDFDASERSTWIAKFRSLLQEALASTVVRKIVADELERIASEHTSRHSDKNTALALLEFLYLEYQWIKVPPLQFKSCRAAIARICLSLMDSLADEPKAYAISILRRVSKTEFIRAAPDIFQNLKGSKSSQRSLLLGLHTYIARDYHHNEPLAQLVGDSVQRLQNVIVDMTLHGSGEFHDAAPVVVFLLAQINFLKKRAQAEMNGARGAVVDLQTNLVTNYPPHGIASAAMMNLTPRSFDESVQKAVAGMMNRSELPEIETIRQQIKNREANWKICSEYLLESVVPQLVVLEQVFDGMSFGALAGPSVAGWVRELIKAHRRGLAPESEIAKSLRLLRSFFEIDGGDVSAAQTMSALRRYRSEVDMLLVSLFSAKKDAASVQQAESASKVAKYVSDFPGDIGRNLDAASQDVRGIKVQMHESVAKMTSPWLVFCPNELLFRLLVELLSNALRHGKYGNTDPSVEITLEEIGTNFQIVARNSMAANEPSVTQNHTHGLDQCREELRSFAATLKCRENPRDVFEVVVSFNRW